ncbi:tetratricopeptide repeat protein, partial [Arthrospira platensis SPKY2]
MVAQDPTHVEARYHLGSLALRGGDHARATMHWQAALDLGRELSGGRSRELLVQSALALGRWHEDADRWADARHSYTKGLERVADDVPLLIALANMESRMGLDEQAVAH